MSTALARVFAPQQKTAAGLLSKIMQGVGRAARHRGVQGSAAVVGGGLGYLGLANRGGSPPATSAAPPLQSVGDWFTSMAQRQPAPSLSPVPADQYAAGQSIASNIPAASTPDGSPVARAIGTSVGDGMTTSTAGSHGGPAPAGGGLGGQAMQFLQNYWPHMAVGAGGLAGGALLANAMQPSPEEDEEDMQYAKMGAFEQGFLQACHQRGCSREQVARLIEKSATVDPKIAKGWQDFFSSRR